MDAPQVKDAGSLEAWLEDKPRDWVRIIAVRLAMRAFPQILQTQNQSFNENVISAFRALFFGWAGVNFPELEMRRARVPANEAAHAMFKSTPNHNFAEISAAQTIFVANEVYSVVPRALPKLLTESVKSLGRTLNDSLWAWHSLSQDCGWLQAASAESPPGRILARSSLWLGKSPTNWHQQSENLLSQILLIDPNYAVWVDWYERRIRGRGSAFDVPGDKRRVEDKRIIRRLTAATNEDFWDLGHEYVNATLKSWLDEARARAAPAPPEPDEEIALPLQEAGAIAYGVNAEGKLDRLPHSDQAQLRNVPDQRRAYADLRQAGLELREEGQRLGPRLLRAIDRFTVSLPERFEDAETYPVWRDANALRRLYRANREAAKSSEPDEAKLEPVIAETLGGLIDLYNNFAFADDGLRAKDEQRIAPQERAQADAEAAAAMPLIEAILSAPDIATEAVRDDLAAEVEQASLPETDPYAVQALGQANRVERNIVAALIEGGRKALSNPKLVGFRLTKGAVEGAGKAIGAAVVVGGIGWHIELLEFIANCSAILQHYVAIAFSTFPHLPDLIERIKALWQSFKLK